MDTQKKKRRLNRDLVIAKAIQLIDDAGSADKIRLNDLASALDIRPPSLYNHISGLDDLRSAVRAMVLKEMLADFQAAIKGKVGREALAAAAHAYRRFVQEHPGVYPLTLSGIPFDAEHTEVSNQIIQLLLLILASYGLKGDDALHAVRAFRSTVHGFISLEAVGGFALPLARDKSFEVLIDLLLDGLAQKANPELVGV